MSVHGKLDPEDLREVMRRYQDAVAGSIMRYEGYVAKYLGDGVLAYFGWPRAYEDQAERAVWAGLDALAAVANVWLEGGTALRVRFGIATGQVVVGDLIGEAAVEADAVSGETPNLAARLQGLAEPGQIVVGVTTRRLIGDAFEIADLGAHRLKGIAEPVAAWQVIGEGMAESRFEAAHPEALTRFVGREHELGLLLERWERAKSGEGQVVVLSGEAGIGKSRLTEELRQRVGRGYSVRLTYQCAPQYVNSAFYPVIRQLQRAAGFETGDGNAAQLDKLEALVNGDRDAVRLLAGLLSLPFEDRYGPLDLAPEARKQHTIQALFGQLVVLSERRPMLLLFEDAHWIDPSSEELLGETVARIADVPVLIVVTHRPEWQAPWLGQPHVTTVSLSRLGRGQAAEIVSAIAGAQVCVDTIARIVARTDGIPLFVEELTKALVERGLDAADADIPATLQASLAARLDRLDQTAKEVAQIGAVIGREFDYDLLAAVAQREPTALDAALDQLLQSQLVLRAGSGAQSRYSFKHALVQDTAYQSLLRKKRRELHTLVGEMLLSRYPDIVEDKPELLAHHYEAAGQDEAAIPYWLQAGRHAIAQSAGKEAVAHLRKGLEALNSLPSSAERLAIELTLQTTIGPVLAATDGWGSDTAGAAYSRAQELSQHVANPEQVFSALWGSWLYISVAGTTKRSYELIDEMMALAKRQRDSDMLMQVHHAGWGTAVWLGRYDEALEHVREGLALYDPDRHRDHAMRFGGHDPAVCGKSQGAMALWFSGRPEQAKASADEGILLARRLQHAPSVAHALMFGSLVCLYLRDDAEALHHARELDSIATEQSLSVHLAFAKTIVAELTATSENLSEAVSLITELLRIPAMTGVRILAPLHLMRLGSFQARNGQETRATQNYDEAEAIVSSLGYTMWLPEILRLKGELALVNGAPIEQVVEKFGRAIEIARAQGGHAFELRAATNLARLLMGQGRVSEARDTLGSIYGWFTEGFDTPDLKDAKALLDELD